MTREEIIEGLQFTIDMFLSDPLTGEPITKPRNNMDKTTIDACKDAIELLQQKPCEDAISRADALKALDYDIKSFEFKSGVGRHMNEIANLLNTIYDIQSDNIKALPSVQPKPKTGHWISYWDEEARCYVYKCPECGNKQPFDTKCCWECGTRLIVTQESEKSNGTH